MPLTKQSLNINFAQGLDTKTDPYQVQPGKFLSLENTVFDKAGRLTKRNGYSSLTALPDNTSRYLTTFNDDLTAIGENLLAYSQPTQSWVSKAVFKPVDLSVLPLVRNNFYQFQADSAVAPNGLVCTAYTEFETGGGSVIAHYYYRVSDSTTGQNIIAPTALTGADATYGTPRVFVLGNYFIILYTTHPAAYHLQYIAISTNHPTQVTSAVDISSSYIPSTTVNFDGVVVGSKLYIAYNTTSGGQSVQVTSIDTTLGNPVTPRTFALSIATLFSLCADTTNAGSPIIYVSFYDSVGHTGYTAAVDGTLNVILNPTQIIASGTCANLASVAQNGICTIFREQTSSYTSITGPVRHTVQSILITQAGSVSAGPQSAGSLGLASKAFLLNGTPYYLGIHATSLQPTYFLIDGSKNYVTQQVILAKLAYSNGGNYYTVGLPGVSLNGTVASMAYLFKDRLQSVNKTQGVSNSAIYSQLGVNLVNFNFKPDHILSSEIGSNLNITGGFVNLYDGFTLSEQGFFLYPELMQASVVSSGGSMTQQQYFYVVTYEWADNQGNLFRSAPSVPLSANVTVGAGSASVTLGIETLQVTDKPDASVNIVIYRWSTAQPVYYQVTSITQPIINDAGVNSIVFTDGLADSAILGNNILYTTGGVIENISPPATSIMTLFNNRLWLVDSEDRNLLWFSKQVIEATPIEMSDLLTLYIAPTTGAQGSTGVITALSPMDDKLIIFKKSALGYISGVGPDNTGANNQYSDFTLINSVVGCTNPQSIVFTPQGLMFQSEKGIWLLGRDLSTQYIGAPVEDFTQTALVQSSLNIPSTNQVRFTLDSGITLVYDYYFGQWSTFTHVPSVSSTLYQGLHTFINSSGKVFQESPGTYLDGGNPVLMSFTTGWLNFNQLQGYQRAYQFYLLGTYKSPHQLVIGVSYDYISSITQQTVMRPTNFAPTYGTDLTYGSGSPYGGESQLENQRIFFVRQRCQSFQLKISEIYDPSYGVAAGEGLTLSGLNCVVAFKKSYRPIRASQSVG